jgi:hypothetical protein
MVSKVVRIYKPAHGTTGEMRTHLELPQLSVISDSARTVYGNTSAEGKAGRMARSARSPCPTSRRLRPPTLPTYQIRNNAGKVRKEILDGCVQLLRKN